jgi:penicillin-binding protein 1C
MKKVAIIALFLSTIVATIFLSPLPFSKEEQRWIFYDNAGEILFSEIPHYQKYSRNERLEKYLIAIEDQNFYSHLGVDFGALVRASFQNLKQKKVTSGASTITMQLARMLFLEGEKHDYQYKFQQIFYALKLEVQFNKDEILKMYLSHAYFGNNATGISAAAKAYFNKPTSALSTAEMATLIGIIPRPDTWNPIVNKKMAHFRRDGVLNILQEKEMITSADFQLYTAQEIKTVSVSPTEFRAPHFVIWAKKKLASKLENASGEIHVRTTLDGKKYKKILKVIRENIENSRIKNISNMSAVALSVPENSLEIMLGSQDFFNKELEGEVNMTTASRETGSTLKPFLFSLALEKGMSPLTEIRDERQSFLTDLGSYSPRNFEPEREHGNVRFREALNNSYNIAAVDLLSKVGTKDFQNLLFELELQPQNSDSEDLSMILGTGESSLLKLTNAYAIFSQNGVLKDIKFFTQINGNNGNILLNWKDFKKSAKQIFQESTSDWIRHSLSDAPARWWNFSQGNPLELPFPSAAKTGTSQDFRDNYVVGFSSEKVVGVWAGNTDGKPMNTSSGIEGAGETWHTIMQILHDNFPQKFIYNSAREEVSVCKNSNQNNQKCAEEMIEFLLPREQDFQNQKKQLNKFSISYPGAGDIFHPDSPILIDVRNVPTGEIVHYFLDGEEVENLIRHLSQGQHIISVRTESFVDMIKIRVEKD